MYLSFKAVVAKGGESEAWELLSGVSRGLGIEFTDATFLTLDGHYGSAVVRWGPSGAQSLLGNAARGFAVDFTDEFFADETGHRG